MDASTHSIADKNTEPAILSPETLLDLDISVSEVLDRVVEALNRRLSLEETAALEISEADPAAPAAAITDQGGFRFPLPGNRTGTLVFRDVSTGKPAQVEPGEPDRALILAAADEATVAASFREIFNSRCSYRNWQSASRWSARNSPAIAFIWTFDPGWPTRFVTPNITRLGYSVDDFSGGGGNLQQIIHQDDLATVTGAVQSARAGQETALEQEFRIMTRDGEVVWVRDRTSIIRDETGTPTEARSIVVDITEQVLAREELRAAEARSRDLARFAQEDPNPVMRIDDSGDVLIANDAAQNLLRAVSEDTPQVRAQWRAFIQRAILEKIDLIEEFDTSDRTILFNVATVRDSSDFNFYGLDVTSQRTSEARLNDFANNFPGALLQYWLFPDERQKIEFLNIGCERIWEIDETSLEDGNPQPLWDLTLPEDRAVIRQSVRASATNLDNWTCEWRIKTRSGAVKWLRGVGIPRLWKDGTITWNSLVQDLTAEKKTEQSLAEALSKTVHVLSAALEARDPYTAGHQQRVADISLLIGRELGLDAKTLEGLELGATIHDIGKIMIPAEILTKPTRLTEAEFNLIKVHPETGSKLLDGVDFEWPIREMILQHHERINGTGYPLGISGDQIVLEARIIGVADTLEAMANDRPYRPGLGLDKAAAELESGAGTRYDGDVVAACLSLIRAGEIKL